METLKKIPQKLHLQFLQAYLVAKDLKEALSFVCDDIFLVSAIKGKVACGKEEVCALWEQTIEQDSAQLAFTCKDFHLCLLTQSVVQFSVSLTIRRTSGDLIQEHQLVQTVTLRPEGSELKIASLHSSLRLANETVSNASVSAVRLEKLLHCENYKAFLDSIPTPVMITDSDCRCRALNCHASKIFGQQTAEQENRLCFFADDEGKCDNCLRTLLHMGETVSTFQKDDRTYKVDFSDLYDDNGQVAGHIQVMSDITELRETRDTIQSISSNIPGGVCDVALDDHFTLLYGNEGFYDIYGYTPLQMKQELNNELLRAIYPEDAKRIAAMFEEVYAKGEKTFEFEKRVYRKDGSTVWVLTKGNIVQTGDGGRRSNCVVLDITKRKKMELELRLSEERLRVALSKTSNIIFDYDIASRTATLYGNRLGSFERPYRLDRAPEFLVERGYLHDDYVCTFLDVFTRIQQKGQTQVSALVRMRLFDSDYLWVQLTLTNILDDSGSSIRVVGIAEDMNLQKEMELAYQKEERYRAALLNDAEIYYEVNLTKDLVENISGHWVPKTLKKQSTSYSNMLAMLLGHLIDEKDRKRFEKTFRRENLMAEMAGGKHEFVLEHRCVDSENNVVWMLTTMHLLPDENGDLKGFNYIKNIDHIKQEELALKYRSERDFLTGLYNKGTTETKIRQVLRGSRGEAQHAFIIFDVDYFKHVNDTYGHMAGDRVLAEISRRLLKAFRSDDILGRIGGDEFVVFLKNMEKRSIVIERARTIQKLFAPVMLDNGQTVVISCSVGIAVYEDGKTFEQLYRQADRALYEAKERGRSQFVFYESWMESKPWSSSSASVIESDHFYSQP